MEMPGRRALFFSVAAEFLDTPPGNGALTYDAVLRRVDRRFNLVRLDAALSSSGAPLARVELASFVLGETTSPPAISTDARQPDLALFKDRVALVIGASRGLGAALARSMATRGCTVIANFHESVTQAESLQKNTAGAAGRIVLLRGDGGSLLDCGEMRRVIEREHGRLDYLVCNAALPLVPLRVHPDTIVRLNEYVGRSLALVGAPLATFLPMLSTAHGWSVTISSSAVESCPPEMSHYISAKLAIEGLVRGAAADEKAVKFVIVRPPRLATDMTNTPLGRRGLLAPEVVADRIVGRLGEAERPVDVELIDDFAVPARDAGSA
jgi:NAD(P)-dependent dehydrogenase (short-subunit alcohol dehydrogenase family)